MSGIFGFIQLDGRPASRDSLCAMSNAITKWGPDGVGAVCAENAAFGHALLVVTHESRYEVMPDYDSSTGILFTAAARLDNRDELCDFFSVPLANRSTLPDGQLVLKAYQKWGNSSPKHLFGDWSFAVWHLKEQRLFMARDHLGNTGLFYYFKPPLFVFASCPEAILSFPGVPRHLDELQLAKNLDFSLLDDDWSRTFWQGVCCLPAAYSMMATSTKIKTENYWRLDDAPSIRLGSDSAYLEGFLDHYRRAVRVRLNSIRPIGTTLSAGLDSSSVTALAAEALRDGNRPLTAFTSVPLHPAERFFSGSITDEWPLAHAVAEYYDNIEHVPIRAEDMTPLAAIRRSLNILHAPQHAATNMLWITSIFENAGLRNMGVLLTGQLGNGGASWSGGSNYIFHLLTRNQWRKGWQALSAWKKHRGCPWFPALKHHILRPILLSLRPDYQSFLHRGARPFYSFPQKDFITRMDLTEKKQGILSPKEERILINIRNGTMVGLMWHTFGAFFNLETRDPTADIRLLEFCMGVPDEQHTFDGGERMLIRRAMAGILPDSVRWNTRRGKQASDILARLINQKEILENEFDRFESIPEVTKYIDITAMKQAWTALRTDQSAAAANANAIMRAVNTAYFLLDLSGHNGDESSIIR